MDRASRILMFPSRNKPPNAANFHSSGSKSCNDTSRKSARLSHRASDTSSSSELVSPYAASAAIGRSGCYLAPMDLELLRNLVPFLMRPYRCRRQTIEDSNNTLVVTRPPPSRQIRAATLSRAHPRFPRTPARAHAARWWPKASRGRPHRQVRTVRGRGCWSRRIKVTRKRWASILVTRHVATRESQTRP